MSVELVTIDFWNTIYDSANGKARNAYRLRALVEEADKFGMLFSADRLNDAVGASWKNFDYFWKQKQRTPDAAETVRFYWSYLEIPHSDEALAKVTEAFEYSVLAHPPRLIEGVADNLRALRERCRLSIISDTGFSPGTILKQLMEQDGILDLFDAFSFSNETGVAKPHEDAYRKILNDLGAEASRAVHIGDNEHTDVKGARSLGMRSIRFSGDITELVKDNPKKTEADFEAFHWNEITQYIKGI